MKGVEKIPFPFFWFEDRDILKDEASQWWMMWCSCSFWRALAIWTLWNVCRVPLKKLWVEHRAPFEALWQCCQNRTLQDFDDSAELYVVSVAVMIHSLTGALFHFLSKWNRIKLLSLDLHKNYYII